MHLFFESKKKLSNLRIWVLFLENVVFPFDLWFLTKDSHILLLFRVIVFRKLHFLVFVFFSTARQGVDLEFTTGSVGQFNVILDWWRHFFKNSIYGFVTLFYVYFGSDEQNKCRPYQFRTVEKTKIVEFSFSLLEKCYTFTKKILNYDDSSRLKAITCITVKQKKFFFSKFLSDHEKNLHWVS